MTQPPADEDSELAALLAAVADDVSREAGMERAGIAGDFGARIRYAMRHMRPQEAAAAVRQLKEQKRAALAALARKTALVMKGRLAAVRRAHGRRSRSQGPAPG